MNGDRDELLLCRAKSKQMVSWLWRASAGGKMKKIEATSRKRVEGSSTQQKQHRTGLELTEGNLDVGTGQARESEWEWEWERQ